MLVEQIPDLKAEKRQLSELIQRANTGDDSAIRKLQEELSGPHAELLVNACGNLATEAETAILRAMFGDQEGSKLISRRSMSQTRQELGWEDASKLERLLIERVVLAWQALAWAEILNAQTSKCTVALAKFNQFRVDRASVRFLSAVKALATVKKLLPRPQPESNEVKEPEFGSTALHDRLAMLGSVN
ncbi:hypothetical protein SH467x_001376 [Pirellulaceae bacterium SH467]